MANYLLKLIATWYHQNPILIGNIKTHCYMAPSKLIATWHHQKLKLTIWHYQSPIDEQFLTSKVILNPQL